MKESTRKKNGGTSQRRTRAMEQELNALRQPGSNHHVLLEHGPAGIAVARDNPLRIVYVNAAMSELTGRTNEELLSSTQAEIINWVHEQDRA